MHVAAIILGCSLCAQAASPRVQPPEMVANALQLPTGAALSGQSLTLVNALSATMDRRQQLDITNAYWRLAQSVAVYHYCFDNKQRLDQLSSPAGDSAALRLAQASAEAALRQAELEAIAVQCELAGLIQLPPGTAMPMPADRPHVGAYRTNFQELFAGRTPPEPLVLIDRVLPIRRQAIDDRAAAVRAAEDVLAAVGNNADEAIAANRELLRQQQTFIQLVCDYNRNIAEYGLAVAGPQTSPQALVATLIGPTQPTATPTLANTAQPTLAAEPMATGAIGTAPQQPREELRTGWRTGQPTLAPPRDAQPRNEPTPAPPRNDGRTVRIDEPTAAPHDEGIQPVSDDEPASERPAGGLQPTGANEPTLAPPRSQSQGFNQPAMASPIQNTTFDEPINIEDKPMVPVDQPATPPTAEPRTSNKPIAGDMGQGADGGEDGTASSLLYPALTDAELPARAKQLALALNWDRSLPEGAGKPMDLAECMRRDPGTDRLTTLSAYWQLRRCSAEYHALLQQSEWLDALTPIALERRDTPTEMLRLRVAQLSTKAAIGDAHTLLLQAQYDLATRLGMSQETVWPLASTAPHAGSYLLNLEAQPRALLDSWPVRRLASTLPALGENVKERSTAVVQADAARADAAEKYRSGTTSIEKAIDGIQGQTQETLALLQSLTDYNRAIADYVLTVMPPATPADRLVAALVVKP